MCILNYLNLKTLFTNKLLFIVFDKTEIILVDRHGNVKTLSETNYCFISYLTPLSIIAFVASIINYKFLSISNLSLSANLYNWLLKIQLLRIILYVQLLLIRSTL